ncbi:MULTISPECIES: DUF2690 domain-containing protein [unclassified Streptomyces]|uniref:DUF2690 domain-containing protein n=1 Tax=unclassified Streptomyces TaxID=2593676 RepID=UPI0003A60D86|nr:MULTISPECIES: DUF2690 domain-containing protein [unclassified Streptomyces]MYT31053.1 DUF2690 domain-containing protein [Streptomyces sp. SID8354]
MTSGPDVRDPADPPIPPSPSLPRRLRARLRGAGRRLRGAGRWLRAHARHALVVGVVTSVVGALATFAADQLPKLYEDPPPSCPGAGCDGKNPQTTGCGVEAATFEPTEGNPVRLHLRYSRRCGAVWGRITAGAVGDSVTVSVPGGPSRSALISANHDVFTPMVTVGDTFRVRFCAVPTTSPERARSWVKYCFEATEGSPWQ